MPEHVWYQSHNGTKCGFTRYTPQEIKAAWNPEGYQQGNAEARARGRRCVQIQCDEKKAITLSALFIRTIYASPSHLHYNGKTLSAYCEDEGMMARVGRLFYDPSEQHIDEGGGALRGNAQSRGHRTRLRCCASRESGRRFEFLTPHHPRGSTHGHEKEGQHRWKEILEQEQRTARR